MYILILILYIYVTASARVRLGTISWECDEPHNAQIDLELAATYYFSGFVENVISSLGDNEMKDSEEGKSIYCYDYYPLSMITN